MVADVEGDAVLEEAESWKKVMLSYAELCDDDVVVVVDDDDVVLLVNDGNRMRDIPFFRRGTAN